MVIAGHFALTASVRSRVPLHPLASVALTVNVKNPVCAGVPARTPPADRLIPAGIAPDATFQANGALPPDADSTIGGYGAPAVAAARFVAPIAMAGQPTVRVSVVTTTHPFASVAITVMLCEPSNVGV